MLGQSYTVSAEIENDSPSPITVDLSWAEIYPASPVVKGTPAAGDIPGISLGADDSTTVPLGIFSHIIPVDPPAQSHHRIREW